MDEIMSFEDLCKYLKLAKSTAYKLARRGDMPSSIVGKQLRFRKSKIDAWMDLQEEKRVKENQLSKCEE